MLCTRAHCLTLILLKTSKGGVLPQIPMNSSRRSPSHIMCTMWNNVMCVSVFMSIGTAIRGAAADVSSNSIQTKTSRVILVETNRIFFSRMGQLQPNSCKFAPRSHICSKFEASGVPLQSPLQQTITLNIAGVEARAVTRGSGPVSWFTLVMRSVQTRRKCHQLASRVIADVPSYSPRI